MPVRTKRLAIGSSVSGVETTLYTAAAGETVILKDVRVYSAGGTSQAVIWLESSGTRVVILAPNLMAGFSSSLQAFLVLLPGDQVRLFSSGGTFNCWLSGAELEGLAD